MTAPGVRAAGPLLVVISGLTLTFAVVVGIFGTWRVATFLSWERECTVAAEQLRQLALPDPPQPAYDWLLAGETSRRLREVDAGTVSLAPYMTAVAPLRDLPAAPSPGFVQYSHKGSPLWIAAAAKSKWDFLLESVHTDLDHSPTTEIDWQRLAAQWATREEQARDVRHAAIQGLAELSQYSLAWFGGSPTGELLCVIALFLVASVAAWRLNRACRPVSGSGNELMEAMRAVTHGDLSARAPVRGGGPDAQLATDFNDMVAVLVETLAAEQRVVEELRRKTRDLEAANRHKSEFLARVSHELKTPLNAVIGFADLMGSGATGPLTDKQRDYCQRIFGAGQHLLAIISDLIDLSRLDLGVVTLNRVPTDLAAAIHAALDLVAPQCEAKEHTLTVDLAPDLGQVPLDRVRFQQVLLNLLGNAIKFTPSGGALTVTARRDPEAGEVSITVRDTGIGIADEDQERIFAEFVQLESPLQRHHEGVGIGLALSRGLMTLMGGRLTVVSAPDQGSAFTLTLPLESL